MIPNISYRSFEDLNKAILQSLHKFSHDVDLIVGVPRSGMLPANLLALYLNKPYTDIDSFIDGRTYGCGDRGNFINNSNEKKIIVIDDSVCTGKALTKVKSKITKANLGSKYNFTYSAVFATKESKDKVDIFCEIVELPRFFQWNLFHHPSFLPSSFCDIDGVLCPNPPIDDDGDLYIKYIKNAPKLYTPTVEIDTLISCRLEKYRTITEEWLKQNGIKYKHLILLNLPSKKDRQKWNKHGVYKGQLYKNSNAILFIESSLWEAQKIQQISRKPVFCIETFDILNNSTTRQKCYSIIETFKILLWKFLCKLHILKK